jgi:hypothetical protein
MTGFWIFKMAQLRSGFDERLEEIETYLEFLEGVEQEVRNGAPRLGSSGLIITARQQRILYSVSTSSSTT